MVTGSELHAAFGLGLLQAVSPEEVNVVCSPWSVGSALAMLVPGADPQARAELEQALSSGASLGDVAAVLRAEAVLVARVPGAGDESILAVANRLWVDEGNTPQPAFVEGVKAWPGGELRSIGIMRDPDAARLAMNADVAETTRDLIPDILPVGSVTSDDRAVLINALYLLAGWVEPFGKDRTEEEPFHAPAGMRQVPTMRGSQEANYAQREGWTYVALPLGLDMQAEVVLPPSPSTGAALDHGILEGLRGAATGHRVHLHLPRFRLSTSVDLTEALQRLGIRRIFHADPPPLTGVVEEGPLFISGAFHQAVLRVDENGVEGAAATALVARAVAFHELPEVEMRVDRPFDVLITHQGTGSVLFLARVAEPGSL